VATTVAMTAHTRPMRAGLVVDVVVVALLASACSGGGPKTTAPPRSPAQPSSPAALASPSAPTTSFIAPGPSSSGTLRYAANDDDVSAGIYATTVFRVPFTALIDTDLGIRDADETPRFLYGQDKNAPLNADEEFDATFLERVVDPQDQRSVTALDGDAIAWLQRHPRLTPVVGSASNVVVDGHPGRQLDLVPSDPVPCGDAHGDLLCVQLGYGPPGDEPFSVFDGSRLRVVAVDTDVGQLLFLYQARDDVRFASRSAVFDHWVRSVVFQ
jgi:hypothetical protein